MTIKDRGNIKWTSMMLTEHRQALEKWARETRKIDKPILDEQKMEEINYLLCESLERNIPLIVKYFFKGKFHTLKGVVENYSPLEKKIIFKGENGDISPLLLSDIMDVGQGTGGF